MLYNAEKDIAKMHSLFNEFHHSDPFELFHESWRDGIFNDKDLEAIGYQKNSNDCFVLDDITMKDHNGKDIHEHYSKEERIISNKKVEHGKEVRYTKKTIKDSNGVDKEEIIEETVFPDGHKEIKEIKNGVETLKSIAK